MTSRTKVVDATVDAQNKRRTLKRWLRSGPWAQEKTTSHEVAGVRARLGNHH